MSVSQKSYQEITDRLVRLLEQGTVPWRKPWNCGEPVQNLTTRRPYRGINPFVLNCQPYGSPFWISYRQAKGLGGHVRRGEKGTPIWFWKWYEKEQPDGEKRRIPVLRRYTVFNVAQCDGLEERIPALTDPDRQPFSPIERAEQIAAGMPARPEIRHGGRQAFYQLLSDAVTMPDRDLFAEPAEYYSTLFHELTHATGHPSRLDRKGVGDGIRPFGSPVYCREELVAEMGAAYLCGAAGIDTATLDNSAAYIRNWIARLKGDATLAVKAAGAAQKAADYIQGREGLGVAS